MNFTILGKNPVSGEDVVKTIDYICVGFTRSENQVKSFLHEYARGLKDVEIRVYLDKAIYPACRWPTSNSSTPISPKQLEPLRNLHQQLLHNSEFARYSKVDEKGRTYFEIDLKQEHYAANCIKAALVRNPKDYTRYMYVYLDTILKTKMENEDPTLLLAGFSIFANGYTSMHGMMQPAERYYGSFATGAFYKWLEFIMLQDTGNAKPSEVKNYLQQPAADRIEAQGRLSRVRENLKQSLTFLTEIPITKRENL